MIICKAFRFENKNVTLDPIQLVGDDHVLKSKLQIIIRYVDIIHNYINTYR